jgi:hypothetical protein
VAKFKARYPELYQAVRTLAETTWQRLRLFVGQAEKEAKELRETLERAAAGTLGPGKKSLKELWREARDRRLAQLPRDPIDEALWANYQEALEKAKAEKRKREAGSQKSGAGSQKPDGGAQKQKSEAGSRKSESATGAPPASEPSPAPNSEAQIPNSGQKQPEQSSIDNHQSSIPSPEPRNPNPGQEGQSSIDNRQSAIPSPSGAEPEPRASASGQAPVPSQSEAPNSEPRNPDPGQEGQSSTGNHPSAMPKPGGQPLDGMRLQWRVERLIGVFLCTEAYPTFKAAAECNHRVEKAFQDLERALQDVLPPVEGVSSQRSAVGN